MSSSKTSRSFGEKLITLTFRSLRSIIAAHVASSNGRCDHCSPFTRLEANTPHLLLETSSAALNLIANPSTASEQGNLRQRSDNEGRFFKQSGQKGSDIPLITINNDWSQNNQAFLRCKTRLAPSLFILLPEVKADLALLWLSLWFAVLTVREAAAEFLLAQTSHPRLSP